MKKIPYLLAIAALTFASCNVNDPIYDTPHPDKGKITLTTDWTNRTAGVAIPANYTARIGEFSATISGTTNEYPHLVPAGNYSLHVHNTADKISVSGTTATVTTTADVVVPMPDWFFSGKASATIVADKSHDITVVMKQEVCRLDITLTVTEGNPSDIASVAGTLAGVTGAWNFDTNSPVGNAVSVAPSFTRTNDKITTTARLLGIVPGAKQEFTLTVTFSDNSTQTIVKDLSSLLTDFNTDKHIPVDIAADVQTQTKVELGFTCTITDWTVTTSRPGTAN